jgi:hypothetical protein
MSEHYPRHGSVSQGVVPFARAMGGAATQALVTCGGLVAIGTNGRHGRLHPNELRTRWMLIDPAHVLRQATLL